MRQRILIRSLLAVAVGTSSVLAAAPARADFPFNQNWATTASYRASQDWLPAVTSVTPYGKSCLGDIFSGGAQFFNESILKTSGSVTIWTSPAAPADGSVYQFSKVGVSIGTSYYFRWRGLDYWGNPYAPSPCQYVGAGY